MQNISILVLIKKVVVFVTHRQCNLCSSVKIELYCYYAVFVVSFDNNYFYNILQCQTTMNKPQDFPL